VLWTTGDAYQRDYRVHVVEDCVAGTSQAGQEAALAIIRALTNAGRPVTSDAVMAALGRHALALTGAPHSSA
jgi:nicotinamidase-related amidase